MGEFGTSQLYIFLLLYVQTEINTSICVCQGFVTIMVMRRKKNCGCFWQNFISDEGTYM